MGTRMTLRGRHGRVSSKQIAALVREKSARTKARAESAAVEQIASLGMILLYLLGDVRKSPRSYLIGTFTIALVVCVLGVLNEALERSPVLFLRLSEEQAGENDLVMLPSALEGAAPTFNFTTVATSLRDAQLVRGAVPRWVLPGRVTNRDEPQFNSSCVVLVIDSEEETAVGLGRGWQERPLGEGEMHMASQLEEELRVRANRGDRVLLSFDSLADALGVELPGTEANVLDGVEPVTVNLTAVLDAFIVNNTLDPGLAEVDPEAGGTVSAADLLSTSFEHTVVGTFSSPDGKFTTQLGNVVVLEKAYVLRMLSNVVSGAVTLNPLLGGADALQGVQDAIDAVNLDENAISAAVQYTHRKRAYTSSRRSMEAEMIRFTNDVAERIGFDFPSSFILPVALALQGSFFLRLFLDQLFLMVSALMVLLGSLLIYSLMLSDVNAKTYEYGMLRALGMQHGTLIKLLLLQSLMFALPGVAGGLIFTTLFNVPVQDMLAGFAEYNATYELHGSTVAIAFAVGLIMPLCANVVPIRRALSRTLRDSLDVYHQVHSEITITVIKLAKMGLSATQSIAALLLVIFGFVVYYLVPLSFILDELPLFFGLLAFVLFGMIMGLSIISQGLQPFLERSMLFCILWGRERRMRHVILKNLASHRPRSRKTFLMFTTALAFALFASSIFELQGNTVQDTIRWLGGADVVVTSPDSNEPLPEAALRDYFAALSNAMGDEYPVAGFSFATFPLRTASTVRWTGFSSLAGHPRESVFVYGVERNYLDVTYSRYFMPTAVAGGFDYASVGGKENVVRSLYDDAGQQRFSFEEPGYMPPEDIVSGTLGSEDEDVPDGQPTTADLYKNYLDIVHSAAFEDRGLKQSTPTRLQVFSRRPGGGNETLQVHYMCKARAVVRKLPGYFVSSYEQTAYHSPVLVTMPEYERLLRTTERMLNVTRTAETPKEKMWIDFKPGSGSADRKIVKNGIKSILQSDTINIFDAAQAVDTVDSATEMLDLFSLVVTTIAITLCFFILWLSFSANIRENSWELGVYRSLGLTRAELVRLYMWEALSLVLSAILMGAIIGVCVALTLALQFNLFLEMPFELYFPHLVFWTVVAMSVALTVLASYLPARDFLRAPIGEVLKGNTSNQNIDATRVDELASTAATFLMKAQVVLFVLLLFLYGIGVV